MTRAETVTAVFAAEMAKPYAYGQSDCFMLGMAIVDTVRGTALAEKYRGSYSTLAGAQKALRKRHHASLVTFMESVIGLDRVAPARAVLGDLAICEAETGGRMGEHVAIHTGAGFVARTARGRQAFRLDQVKAAFRV